MAKNKNIKMTFLAVTLFLSGCFFARVDYERPDNVRISGTLWTLGKRISIDPNSYASDNDGVKLVYPPFFLETAPRTRQNSNLWDKNAD